MNYYNDIDSFSCAWLRELIADGLIPNGDVDERSIADIEPADLRGYTQCHFFAGIAGWSRALELAGWPEDREVWTGSCPCQPFSVAGKSGGLGDERHLWPAFHALIAECRPSVVFGEQVASALGRDWLTGVRIDLEGMGYAVGAADLCAPSVGAPHIRQRLYWVAHTAGERWGGRSEGAQAGDGFALQTTGHVNVGGLADTADQRTGRAGQAEPCGDGTDNGVPRTHGREGNRMADTEDAECERAECTRDGRSGTATGGRVGDTTFGQDNGRERGIVASEARARRSGDDAADVAGSDVGVLHPDIAGREEQCGAEPVGAAQRSVERAGFWDNSILIPCRDGKARRVEPSIFPLAHGFPNRVGCLRGAGNAIVPPLAAEFVRAYMETEL